MDKRRLNGGNSTKAKGVDKRKNAYRNAVEEAITPNDIIEILHKFKDLFMVGGDIQAGKTVLEYCVTKPTTEIDLKSNGEAIIPNVTITQEESDRINKELDDEC